MLLGDVRELEVEREGAEHERLPVERQRRNRLSQLRERRVVALACLARELPDPLYELEQPLGLLLDEHLAKEVAEQPDVRPDRGIRSAHRAMPRHFDC